MCRSQFTHFVDLRCQHLSIQNNSPTEVIQSCSWFCSIAVFACCLYSSCNLQINLPIWNRSYCCCVLSGGFALGRKVHNYRDTGQKLSIWLNMKYTLVRNKLWDFTSNNLRIQQVINVVFWILYLNPGWHANVYNICKLTSKHLRPDFYTFANWPETFAKLPLVKWLVGKTTG